jgi:hypothetical protein
MTTALTLLLTEAQAENAIQLLDDAQGQKLDTLVREVADIQRAATGQPLATAGEVHTLNNLLGRAAKATKELDRLRRERVDPLNAEVGNVNGLFRPITHSLEQLTERGKKLISAWQAQERAREAREREEARRRQEEAARKEAEALAAVEAARTEDARQAALAAAEEASRQQTALAVNEPPPAPKGYKSDEATTSVKGRWVFEVVRPDMIPREYLEPAPQKIRAAVAAGVRDIPGVLITQEDQVIVRSR